MRPKFVFTLLLFGLLVLGAALVLKRQMGGEPAPPAPSTTVASVPAAPLPIAAAPAPAATTTVSATTAPTNTLTAEEREAEINRLWDWSANNDPASLSHILADLTNSDQEVRDTAIEATKEFGSTDAIPALKAAAASAQDTEEQIALLEAAEFLSLPSLDFSGPDTRTLEQVQADQQRNAQKEAHRQAQRQRHISNQGSQSAPDQSAAPPPEPNQSATPDNQTPPE